MDRRSRIQASPPGLLRRPSSLSVWAQLAIRIGLLLALLAIIVAVAAFFRLYELGLSAFRADTILLWELAKRQVPPSMIFTDWFEVSGAAGQMPMPAFITAIALFEVWVSRRAIARGWIG